MAQLQQSIEQAVKNGLIGSNVQLRLAIIDDGLVEETGTYTTDSGTLYTKRHRVNLKVFEESALVPYPAVIVQALPGIDLIKIQPSKSGKQQLALVAMLGKGRTFDSAVIIALMEPRYDQNNPEEGNVAGIAKVPFLKKIFSNGGGA